MRPPGPATLNATLQMGADQVRAVDLAEAHGSDLVALYLGDGNAQVGVVGTLDEVTEILNEALRAIAYVEVERERVHTRSRRAMPDDHRADDAGLVPVTIEEGEADVLGELLAAGKLDDDGTERQPPLVVGEDGADPGLRDAGPAGDLAG